MFIHLWLVEMSILTLTTIQPGFRSPEKKRKDRFGMVPFKQESCLTPVMEHADTPVAPEVAKQHGLVKKLAFPSESLFNTKKLGYSPGKTMLDRESRVYLRNKFEKKLFDSPSINSSEILRRSTENDSPVPSVCTQPMSKPDYELRLPLAAKEIDLDCAVGEVTYLQLPVANSGSDAVRLSSRIESETHFEQDELYIEKPSEIVVGGQSECTLKIVFRPIKARDIIGTLVLEDPRQMKYMLPLRAKSQPIGPICCMKLAIDFGGIPLDSRKRLLVNFRNVTGTDLRMCCIVAPAHQAPMTRDEEGHPLDKSEAMQAFSVSDNCKTVWCRAHDVVEVEIAFTPRVVARYRAKLILRIDDLNWERELPILGYGGRSQVLASSEFIRLNKDSLTANGCYEKQVVLKNVGDRAANISSRPDAGVVLIPAKEQIPPHSKKEFTVRYKHFARKDTKLRIKVSDQLIHALRKDLRARANGFGLDEESRMSRDVDTSLQDSAFTYPELDTTIRKQRRRPEFVADHCDLESIYEKQLEVITVHVNVDAEEVSQVGWSVSRDKILLNRRSSTPQASTRFYVSNFSSASLIFAFEPSEKWLSCSPSYLEIDAKTSAQVTVTADVNTRTLLDGEAVHAKVEINCLSNFSRLPLPVEYNPRATDRHDSSRTWFTQSTLEFEPTRIGTIRCDSVRLQNRGNKSIHMKFKIHQTRVSKQEQFYVRKKHKEIILKPMSYIKLPVFFAPTLRANYFARLIVQADGRKRDYVYLYGSGIPSTTEGNA